MDTSHSRDRRSLLHGDESGRGRTATSSTHHLREPSYWLSLAACLTSFALVACSGSRPSSEQAEPAQLVGEPTRPTHSSTSKEPKNDADREGALWYRIGIHDHELDIRLRLLRPAPTSSFFVPRGENKSGVPESALTFQGARGPGGPVALEQLPGEGRIDVETHGLDWVELAYTVDLGAFPDDASRPVPDRTEDVILAYIPSLLVVPSKQIATRVRDIPVEIHAPRNWTVRATWPRSDRQKSKHAADRSVHGFVARDIRSLRDAFFVGGPNLGTITAANRSVTVTFESRFDGPRNRVTELVSRVVGAYRARFGTIGPVLTHVRPAKGDDAEGLRGTAKRHGFMVRLPEERPLRKSGRILVAHEAFHLWNGHHAIPKPDAGQRIRWFEEGFTHYMGIKTLYEMGLVDLETVRQQLAKSAFFYRRNPAADGGDATRLDVHRLPYDRGVLLTLALDGALTRCSSSTSSPTGWFRNLLGNRVTYYDMDRLESAYFETAGGSCPPGREVWETFVDEPRHLEPAELLADVGLHYLEASTVQKTKVLPIEGGDALYESLFERAETSADREASLRNDTVSEPSRER